MNRKTTAALAVLGLVLPSLAGAESGDDEVLARIDKGETFDSTATGLNRLAEAGVKRSVMILNGLGGANFWRQHAINSAKLVNATQPEYLATLVVTFPKGEQRYRQGFEGQFEPLDQSQLFAEMELMLETLDLKSTIFRSDQG